MMPTTFNPALIVVVLALLSACASNHSHPAPDITPATLLERTISASGTDHKIAIWVPANYNPKHPTPCVIFLHGSGECGTDGLKQTTVGLLPAAKAHPDQWPCIIIMPQKPVQKAQWEDYEPLVLASLKAAQSELNIDKHRTSLTGLSQGGHGTWMIGAHHPDLFSAFAPCCAYGDPALVANKLAGKPVWAFHGEKDDVVPPADTMRMIEAIRAQHKSPEPKLTLYPDANHNCWDNAYNNENLGLWLTSQKLP